MTTDEETAPRFYRCQWSLLREAWCVAKDLTAGEEMAMCEDIRDSLGEPFRACPLEFIRDRLYGGFRCGNDGESRRHVCFATGDYSFTGERARYFYPADDRLGYWKRLVAAGSPFVGDGPFTDDVPKEAISAG